MGTHKNRRNAVEMDVLNLLRQITPTPHIDNGLSEKEKVSRIREKVREIMQILGLDLSNDSISDSPDRIAEMYVHELFRGLNPQNFPRISVIENKMKYKEMLVVRDVTVLSTCEHHFATIDGKATLAYIPQEKIIGLSKLNRIVDYFARRPQVQERLTVQIADCMQKLLETPHVAVHINAKHYCVIARGVEDVASTTVTSEMRGDFKDVPVLRMEFLQNCKIDLC